MKVGWKKGVLKMEEIKNKMITISGDPASGKSTVIEKLKEKYEKNGFTVHVISTGALFRQTCLEEYLKMFPDKKGATLSEIQADPAFRDKLVCIDEIIDEKIKKMGIEINQKERPNQMYMIDSRLAWKNVPFAYSIRLTVSDQIAGDRVFHDQTRGLEEQYATLSQAIEQTKLRKKCEIERYKQKYNVDLTNPENYQLIIDTSYSKADEIADVIANGIEAFEHGDEPYPKHWASPVSFLPSQSCIDCGAQSMFGYTIESLAEIIKKEGYDPILGTLHVLMYNDVPFLADGHHRLFAQLSTGKTLVPYEIIHQNDDQPIAYDVTSREGRSFLYDYLDGLKYYGGKIGQLKQFQKQFSFSDLIYYAKATEDPIR